MASKIQYKEKMFGVRLKKHLTSKRSLNTTLCSQLMAVVYGEEINMKEASK